jgi:hypothetical protein
MPERRKVGSNLTRGAIRGLTADLLGAPVDLATDVTNLGIAGGGYVGHKLGLLQSPPDILEKKNVPFSSDWYAKNTPLEEQEGEGSGYDVARIAANFLPAILRGGGVGKLPSRTAEAPRGSAEAQRGAIYLDKQGELQSKDLAMYHTTEGIMGRPREWDMPKKSGPPLKELTHPSFAITSSKGNPDDYNSVMDRFGPNIIVPNPRGLDPKTSNTSLKSHDFYTPRRGMSSEAAVREMEETTGIKAPPEVLARARLEDKFDRPFAKGGTGAEGGGDKGMVAWEPSTMSMNTTPRFQSFEHFANDPKGAALLRKSPAMSNMMRTRYDNLTAQEYGAIQRAKGLDPDKKGVEIANALQSTALNPKYWSGEPLSAKDIRKYGGHVKDPKYNDPEFVKAVTERLRAYKKENIDYTPSEYAELKKYGPWGINKENVLAYFTGHPEEAELAQKMLTKKGIPVYERAEFSGDKEIHDMIAEMQSYALRRGKGR